MRVKETLIISFKILPRKSHQATTESSMSEAHEFFPGPKKSSQFKKKKSGDIR